MTNPLLQCISSAERSSNFLQKSFDRAGIGDHPPGAIKTAYRNAVRAMRQALQEEQRVIAVSEVMSGLRASVRGDMTTLLEGSQSYGSEEAIRQLGYYGVEIPKEKQGYALDLRQQLFGALDAIEGEVKRQEAAIMGLILTSFQPEQIVGDDERRGILAEGAVLAAAAFWLGSLLWNSFSYWTNQSGISGFQKQAIAAIDHRTTDTCLHVHGQIQPTGPGPMALRV